MCTQKRVKLLQCLVIADVIYEKVIDGLCHNMQELSNHENVEHHYALTHRMPISFSTPQAYSIIPVLLLDLRQEGASRCVGITTDPALRTALQLAALVLLWGAFLLSQMLKAKYKPCTWEFGAIAGGQALLLAAFTAAVLRYQSWKAKVRCHTTKVYNKKYRTLIRYEL